MSKDIKREKHTLNAKDKAAGRIATKVARFLIGKNKVNFEPHRDMGDFVTIENASEIKTNERKMENTTYQHHTGHPGGIKEKSAKELFEESPSSYLRKVIKGMLPKNKLRSKQLKRLTIKE